MNKMKTNFLQIWQEIFHNYEYKNNDDDTNNSG